MMMMMMRRRRRRRRRREEEDDSDDDYVTGGDDGDDSDQEHACVISSIYMYLSVDFITKNLCKKAVREYSTEFCVKYCVYHHKNSTEATGSQ